MSFLSSPLGKDLRDLYVTPDVLRSYLETEGFLWAIGANGWGDLGLGHQANKSYPTQVGSLSTWITAAAGNSTLGILA